MSLTLNTLEKQIRKLLRIYRGFNEKNNILTLSEDFEEKEHDKIIFIFKELNNKSEYKNISYSDLYNNIKSKLDAHGFGGSNSNSFSLPTINIDNSGENSDNISDYNMIINTGGSNNYNISVKQVFKKVYNNTTENIQNIENIENITNDNSVKYFIDNSKIIVEFGDDIYNFNLKLFFSLIYNNIQNNISNVNTTNFSINNTSNTINFSNFFDYSKIVLNYNNEIYNFNLNLFFSMVYNNINTKITDIDINNFTINNTVDIINYNTFIQNGSIAINYENNIYNLKLNLFLLFIFRHTNIDIDIDIDSYNISINNNNTINNISITNLFQYFIKKFDNLKEIEPPSTNNIDIYYYNNQVIFDTKKNVTFDSISLTSDIRFKENINPLNNCLNKLNKLKPKEFNYKNNKNKKCIGFIAQDILETELEYIVEQKDKEHYKVDYNNVIGLLTGSVQELTQELKSLKQEMKDIKEQNKLLKELLLKSSN